MTTIPNPGADKATDELPALTGSAFTSKLSYGVYLEEVRDLRSQLAALAGAPADTSQQVADTFCWLVELRPSFDGHPAFPATYYAGWVTDLFQAAKTQDPYASPRFTRKADAEQVAKQLGHTLSCTWEAVDHGFHDTSQQGQPVAGEPVRQALQWAVARIEKYAPHRAAEGDGELYALANAKHFAAQPAPVAVQPAGELPPLPEWSKRDDLGGLVPSEIRQALRDYARAALAARQAPDDKEKAQ